MMYFHSFLASVIIFSLSTVQFSNAVVSETIAVPNPIWDSFQPKLRKLVDSFERICVRQGVDFNRAKLEEELQTCFRPPMQQLLNMVNSRDPNDNIMLVLIIEKLKKNDPVISQREIELLQVHLVEPICYFTTTILDCFNPHYSHIVEKCTTDPEGKAMQYSDQIIISACKNNGSRLIEFLEVGGLECVDSYFTNGLECLNGGDYISFGETRDLFKQTKKPETLLELCGNLEKVHECLTNSLDSTCDRKEPTRVAHSVLDDVKAWTMDACFKSSSSSNNYVSFTLISVLSLLLTFWKVM